MPPLLWKILPDRTKGLRVPTKPQLLINAVTGKVKRYFKWTVIQLNNGTDYLLRTAHPAHAEVALVSSVVRRIQPRKGCADKTSPAAWGHRQQ
jgi:hypothetical protein